MALLSVAAVGALAGAVLGSVVQAQPLGGFLLAAGQSILEADAVLLASGWRPAPQQKPLPMDQQRAGVPLSSLTACSGTGYGFCRFDYRRNGRQLSVVTLPDAASSGRFSPIGGVVHRWWVETLPSTP